MSIYLAVIWLLKIIVFKLFVFRVGCVLENVFSPKGWQKNSQNYKIPECSDLIGFHMVLAISICKFDAKNTSDAFKHVSDVL